MSDKGEIMNKKPEITAVTRQNIIDAFWKLYTEKRIEKITVKEITEIAGYNRSTFYQYFTDVYDVLEQLEDSLIPTLESIPPISSSKGSIGMPMDMFFQIYEQNSKYYSILLGDKGDPAFAGKLKNRIKPVISNLLSTKTNIDYVELEYILEYTLSAMIGIMSYHYTHHENYSNIKLFELVTRLMDSGVISQLEL